MSRSFKQGFGVFRLTVLLESRWFLLLDNISKERGFLFFFFFPVMPPPVLVYRAGRCWSLPFPRLELLGFISQGDGFRVSELPIPVSGLAKNYYNPRGGAAKSLPLPVTDNILLEGGRQAAPPASLFLALPFPSFSISFFFFGSPTTR